MEIQHFSHEEHPLMLVEEFENDGENEVVCSGCDKSVSCGPAYNCSQCKFFLHKSCAELPPEIQHPVHPNHTLLLQAPISDRRCCDACGRGCKRCFSYRCHSCNFDLDIGCVSASLPTKPDDGHQHEFVPIFQQFHFTCELCGEDRNNAAQVCRICQLLADTLCALKPSTIKITADPAHLLTLIYSLRKVIKEHSDIFCKLCYKKLNPNFAGYYCQECDFVAHLKCTPKHLDIDSSIDLTEDIDFKEDEELEELQHFDHDHKLIISRNEVEVHDHKLCEGCVQSISVPFYSCEQCDYLIHSTCARLPLKKRHLSHPHLLTLSARGQYIDGIVFCYACLRYSHGFAYTCHECDYSLDIQCCSIPKTFKYEGHQHSLFYALNLDEKCNACDRLKHNSGGFVCTKCNFALDLKCATLPLKVKYEYHPHSLSFTHTIAKNDSKEYYCLICEEERNPDHWFYYCAECNFTAHSQCIVGWDPYIKYGKTFITHLHQHLLTWVRKTKVSPPCDACGITFNGELALNCTQCKFIVHWKRKCREKVGVKEVLSADEKNIFL
ncbi:uncharacterized protein LOC133878166 [Alnus glutinosa]|uniref:uncharacterized protein LOC133878166 n=1 Tax=Alnus glutinosa TaxID=3517 RepID=UPI002D780BFC|nr:uncharacterized protein LOC133878166 [Alnus glutinosa]